MSRILLMGATGFIGTHLHRALQTAGYEVIAAARTAGPGMVRADFAHDIGIEHWMPRLAGVDVLINAAGAFVDDRGASLESVHSMGPRAMFDAAVRSGVQRIVQISALGADMAATRFLASKSDADNYLASLPIQGIVMRPSLVFGPGGRSAQLLLALATAPWLLLPRAFRSEVQPVHVDDVVAAVLALLKTSRVPSAPIAIVGPCRCSLVEYVQILRRQLGLPRARVLFVPDALLCLAGRLPPLASHGFLSADAIKMLTSGSTADVAPLTAVLGRAPQAPEEFISRAEAPALVCAATLSWTLPMLRWSIALLWIASGVVSLGIYPVEQSHALLAQVGIPASLWSLSLYSAAALDIMLGLAVLLLPHHRLVWLAQIALVLVYTVIISVWLPEFWLHPFGPLVKNLPLLAAFYMLQRLAIPRWPT